MRYAEEIKYSWGYHWGVCGECWDMLTGELHWWIVGLLFALCFVPSILIFLTPPAVVYYATNPVPAFAPSLSQELAITEYYWNVGGEPLFFWAFNYFWVNGNNFRPLTNVLSIVVVGLLLVAYLREE